MSVNGTGDVCTTALREGARAGRELRGHGSVGSDPVGEGVLAVLNDGLGSLVSVVCSAGLAGGDRGVIDKIQEVLTVASNDSELLTVFAESIELVGVGGLELLAGNVGELGLGDKRFGLSTDKLLFENDDLGRVGLLVLELSNLVGNLLLSCSCNQPPLPAPWTH
jgi:hypothetical protein